MLFDMIYAFAKGAAVQHFCAGPCQNHALNPIRCVGSQPEPDHASKGQPNEMAGGNIKMVEQGKYVVCQYFNGVWGGKYV